MAALKAKVTLRLERGGGDDRVFWEITRSKATITTRFGRHLGAGRTIVREHESPAAAAKAFDKAAEEKRREGYGDPFTRAEAGAASRKGVSSRNPEFEALIDEAPDDPERYLVYADWLQQQGDPRGELIILQHRLATSTDRREIGVLERDQRTLFKKFEAELLGPLAPYVFLRNSVRSFRTFSWRCGFIRAARLSRLHYRPGREGLSQVLDQLFRHPSGRFLERLFIGDFEGEDAGSLFEQIGNDGPPTLVSLVVGDGAPGLPYIEPVWSLVPRLRALELTGRVDDFGGVRGDNLELLRVGWADHHILESISRSLFPALRTLHVTCPLRESERYIVELLRGDGVPALDRLTVRRWVAHHRDDDSYELVPQDVLAREVAIAAAARKLPRLDLEMPIGEEGATRFLEHASALREIGELRVPQEGVPRARRAALAGALPNLAWTEAPEEEELDLDEIDEGPAPYDEGRAPAVPPLSSRAEPR